MDFNSGILVNGIDLGFINKMIDRVKENPDKGQRTYKATSVWLGSTKSESTIRDFKVIMDEPFGTNEGPQPGEMILAALGACLVVGYTFDGALHNIELKKIAIEVEGDVVSTKFFQIPSEIIPNLSTIRVKVDIESDTSLDILEEMHKRVTSISPVCATLGNKSNLEFNVTMNGIPRP